MVRFLSSGFIEKFRILTFIFERSIPIKIKRSRILKGITRILLTSRVDRAHKCIRKRNKGLWIERKYQTPWKEEERTKRENFKSIHQEK